MGGGKSSGSAGSGYVGRRIGEFNGPSGPILGQRPVVEGGGGEKADKGFSSGGSSSSTSKGSEYSKTELGQMAKAAGLGGLTGLAVGPVTAAMAAVGNAAYEKYSIDKSNQREALGMNPAPAGTPRISARPKGIRDLLNDEEGGGLGSSSDTGFGDRESSPGGMGGV